MSKKIVFCNNDITDIKYSGFTITKVYACGGELVYENNQPTPCQTSSLPTPFVLNYNAKVYNSSTHTIPMTSGQTNNIDCVLTGDVQNVVAYQDHISLANTTNVKALVTGGGQFNNHCCITIVAKAVNRSSTIGSDLLVNRTTSGYNWMFRWTSEKVAFHGTNQINGVAVSSSEPNIVSVIADRDFGVIFRNHTTGEIYEDENFTFGDSGLTSGGTMFAEYADDDNKSHFWNGDFYWIYMTDGILSESEINKIIEYNESCFGVIFDWRKAPATDYACVGVDKHYKEYYEYSMDSGTTWNRVYPTSSRTSDDVIEYNSVDCGYTPPFKYKLTLNDSSVTKVECDATSSITLSDISGYSSTCVGFEIGSCVTDIGYYTFSGFTNLTSCTIGDSVTSINHNAFNGCVGLTNMVIPDNVTSIGTDIFIGCTGITNCTIGSGVTNIPGSAFEGCTSLTNVTIPNTVTSIGSAAFNGCTSLTGITIPNSVTSIGTSAFNGCTNLESIEIPDSVTEINKSAFNKCTSLTSCTIGLGVGWIGEYAFYGCSGLTSITVEGATPPGMGRGVFDNTNECPIFVPADSVNAYKIARYWSTYSSRIRAIPT